MIKSVVFNKKELQFELEDEADFSVFSEIFIEKEYRCVEELIKNARGIIVDVGAHKGLFSSYVRALNPTVPVLAFEPDEKNFSYLKKNLAKNHIDGVRAKSLAVAGRAGRRTFSLSVDSHNHSLVEDFGEAVGERLVECTTLEEVFHKNGVERCALLKIDCEGAEFEILETVAAEVFNKTEAFYVEYHQFTAEMQHQRLVKIFEKNGFRVQSRTSPYDKRFGFILAEK